MRESSVEFDECKIMHMNSYAAGRAYPSLRKTSNFYEVAV